MNRWSESWHGQNNWDCMACTQHVNLERLTFLRYWIESYVIVQFIYLFFPFLQEIRNKLKGYMIYMLKKKKPKQEAGRGKLKQFSIHMMKMSHLFIYMPVKMYSDQQHEMTKNSRSGLVFWCISRPDTTIDVGQNLLLLRLDKREIKEQVFNVRYLYKCNFQKLWWNHSQFLILYCKIFITMIF